MADGEPGVPQRIKDLFRNGFEIGRDFPVIEKKQIDVGLRIQFAASIAPLRREYTARVEARITRDVVLARRLVNPNNESIDERRIGRDDLATRRARAVPLEQRRPRALDVRTRTARRIAVVPRVIEEQP